MESSDGLKLWWWYTETIRDWVGPTVNHIDGGKSSSRDDQSLLDCNLEGCILQNWFLIITCWPTQTIFVASFFFYGKNSIGNGFVHLLLQTNKKLTYYFMMINQNLPLRIRVRWICKQLSIGQDNTVLNRPYWTTFCFVHCLVNNRLPKQKNINFTIINVYNNFI